MAPDDLPGCYKHEREHWWRLRADSPATPEGEHGIWTCGLCHPMPEPLRPQCEPFDERVHGPVFDAAVRARYPSPEPEPVGHVIGQATPATLTLETATALIEKWKAQEFGWVRALVVTLARIHHEYHADLLIGMEVHAPAVGAAINSLSKSGLLEKASHEPRQTKNPTSRRASYPWRLTPRGQEFAMMLRRKMGNTDRLPRPPRRDAPEVEGAISADGQYVQERVV
jgi:hypothetical protein